MQKSKLNKREQNLAAKVANNEELLAEVLRLVRADGRAEHRFDLNLAEGKEVENRVAGLLSGKEKIEVKRDFKVSDTGRVAIEYEHGGLFSGISTTESDWYAIVLDGEQFKGEIIIFITTERLKRLVTFAPGRVIEGDGNKSTFKALSLSTLLMDDESIEDYRIWRQNTRTRKLLKSAKTAKRR